MMATCGLWDPKKSIKKRWPVMTSGCRTQEMKDRFEAWQERDLKMSKLRHPIIAGELQLMHDKAKQREEARQHGDYYFSEHGYEIELTIQMINGGYHHRWPLYANTVYVQEGLPVRRWRHGRAKDAYRLPIQMPYIVKATVDYKKGTLGWLTNYVHPRTIYRLEQLSAEFGFGPIMVTINNVCRANELHHDETPVFGLMNENSSVGFMSEESAILFAGMIDSGAMDDEYDHWKRT